MRTVRVVALALAVTWASSVDAEAARVRSIPHLGDINTTFVFAGSGFRPRAVVVGTHGPLCDRTGPCTSNLFGIRLRTDRRGRFRFTEHPADQIFYNPRFVPDDFVGYPVCFGYAHGALPESGPCAATAAIALAPPSVTVTPVRVFRPVHGVRSALLTIAIAHYRAGQRLRLTLSYPDGRVRHSGLTTRRRGRFVGAAYASKGGAVSVLSLREDDPDGTYHLGVSGPDPFAEARTEFVVSTGGPVLG